MKLAKTLALAAVGTLALTGCSTLADLPTERLASARMNLANGAPAGTAQLVSNGNDLSLAIAVTGIPAGAHGFHLHTTGRCERPDFSSAGGHLNPTNEGHGLEDNDGSHLGDLPNLVVPASGSVSTTVDIRGPRTATLDALFDADGTAIIIHADPDDGTTDPSGNAGSRIACGVLTRV